MFVSDLVVFVFGTAAIIDAHGRLVRVRTGLKRSAEIHGGPISYLAFAIPELVWGRGGWLAPMDESEIPMRKPNHALARYGQEIASSIDSTNSKNVATANSFMRIRCSR
jgi:hypothetical protein